MNPRLSHEELAALHDAGRFDELWKLALPEVTSALYSMVQRGQLLADDVDDDMRQECALAANATARAWSPIDFAFGTWILVNTRRVALNYLAERNNAGIGSKHVDSPALSLGELRDGIPDEDEDGVDGTIEGALTYAGLVGRHGQVEGGGHIPEDCGDPADEAERAQLRERLAVAMAKLPWQQRELLRSVYGVGRFPLSVEEYALAEGLPRRTAYNRHEKALAAVAQTFAPRG